MYYNKRYIKLYEDRVYALLRKTNSLKLYLNLAELYTHYNIGMSFTPIKWVVVRKFASSFLFFLHKGTL